MIKTNIEDIYNTDEEPEKVDYNIDRNRIYFSRRKELYQLIKSISNYIKNNSQSLFLTLYLMDTIFLNEDLENIFYSHFTDLSYMSPLSDIHMNNYVLLSLACLVITDKFSENDPRMPSTNSFVKLVYHFSKKKYSFSTKDLITAEVVAIKLLKYKLNYYTIYHFLVFFFTHGILFKRTIQKTQLYKKFSEKKILEKIYIETREILDWIIQSDEYYNYYYGRDNHIIVVECLLWSIEHVLGITLSDNENIFKLIYNIYISEEKHLLLRDIIEKLYMDKKGNVERSNKPIFITKNYSKQTITYNNPISYPTISQSKNSIYNINSSQNLKNNIAASYNNIYNTLPTYDESFSIYNGLIHSELDKFNTNYPYQLTIPSEQSETEMGISNSIPKFIGLSNRSFYNSNKNITTNYDINSDIPIDTDQIIHTIPSSQDVMINESKFEKEPHDNHKKKSILDRYNENIFEINLDDIKGRKIYMNDGAKVKKKSLSCSKKPNNSISCSNINYDYQIKSTFIDTSNINNINDTLYNEDELKFEEKINKPKVFDNKVKININNFLYNVSPNQKFQPTNNIKNEKETLFKKYKQATSNEHIVKNLNKNSINKVKNVPNSKIISSEELSNRYKNLFTVTKINQTVENEPRDNTKRSMNKIKKSNGIYSINSSGNINKSINKINTNKHNTIIINNNIHINNYYDNQSFNEKKPVNSKTEKKKKNNIFVFSNFGGNNVNDLLNLPHLNTKNKNNKNKQKLIYDLKNGKNIINKRSTITNGYNYNNEFEYNNQF